MEAETRTLSRDDVHASYVERSIKELQRLVDDNEGVLAQLRRSAGPVPATPATSLAIMRTGYEKAAEAEPFLPFPDSVLPSLLALRKAHQVAAESKAYQTAQEPALETARRQLAAETARLEDEKALQQALEARLEALRSGLETHRDTTPTQRRREKLDVLRKQKRTYDKDTATLLRELRKFIHDRLGPMLAAEELGGPVVGGIVDIQADDLAAGFSAQGKLKKARPSSEKQHQGPDKTAGSDAKRQRRIDEIWGPRGGQQEDNGKDGNSEGDAEQEGHWDDEATAAGAEMQELAEQLLNTLAESGGDGSAAYVTLARESAAARFLVRSKAAQFHPRDARKLRLVDFGRDLDD